MAGSDIVNFLNNSLAVPDKPNLATERLNPTYVPDVGAMGFGVDAQLGEELKARLSKMSQTFPYDGISPEELGAVEAMAQASSEITNGVKTYVDKVNHVGKETVALYGLEQQHKANFLNHDLAVKAIDLKHTNQIGDWQGKSDQIVNAARQKVAYLRTIRARNTGALEGA